MDYLNEVLGVKVIYEDVILNRFPNFIITRYQLQVVSLDKKRTIFLYPKTELEQIAILKKHIKKIQDSENLPVVLILEQITARQKEYLIREKIPFIVTNKQIYLPFMAVYLQERCSAEKQPHNEILPSAQMLLLHFIYCGSKELSTSQAAKDLKLTPTSISRASKQLEDMNLIKSKKIGVQKLLFSDISPKMLFQKAESKLLNPIKRTIYVPKDSIKLELLESGYLALAEYSMLNMPNVKCYATNKASLWKKTQANYLQDSQSEVAIEIWRYDPRKLSHKKTVDELSLALALRENIDERVEEAVEEMLNNLWRKLDGYRN